MKSYSRSEQLLYSEYQEFEFWKSRSFQATQKRSRSSSFLLLQEFCRQQRGKRPIRYTLFFTKCVHRAPFFTFLAASKNNAQMHTLNRTLISSKNLIADGKNLSGTLIFAKQKLYLGNKWNTDSYGKRWSSSSSCTSERTYVWACASVHNEAAERAECRSRTVAGILPSGYGQGTGKTA